MSIQRKNGAWINQPLTVGVLVVLATFVTQQWGWKQQQQFLATQTKDGLAIQEMSKTVEEAALAVGRALAASAIILGAHKERIDLAQYNDTIDHYHALQREWDLQEDLLKHKVRKSFPFGDVSALWSKVLIDLGELDEQVRALHQFEPANSSQEHIQQIELVGDTIEKIERQLAALTDQMTTHCDIGARD